MSNDLLKLIRDFIPDDHSRQVNSSYYIDYVLDQNENTSKIVDLGCGIGDSFKPFTSKRSDIQWIGLDLLSSPEVALRTETDAQFIAFDGVNIPIAGNCLDVVYCNQVLEHVRYPSELLKEVARVLRLGGYLLAQHPRWNLITRTVCGTIRPMLSGSC